MTYTKLINGVSFSLSLIFYSLFEVPFWERVKYCIKYFTQLNNLMTVVLYGIVFMCYTVALIYASFVNGSNIIW